MGRIIRGISSAAGGFGLAMVLALAGCGGGGGGDDSSGGSPPPVVPPPVIPPASTDHPLATISSDTLPTGARIDVSAKNLLPLNAGDRAVFALSVAGAASGTATREAAAAVDASGNVVVTDSDGVVERYKVAAEGLILLDPFRAQGTLPGVYDAMPSVVLVPTPFYPVGSTVIHYRQGALNADADGDGRSDYFEASFIQTFLGFETPVLFGSNVETAHFRTEWIVTIQSVATGARRTTSRFEDMWLASGIGPVRFDRGSSDGTTTTPTRRLDLQSATVGGVPFPGAVDALGPKRSIDLKHEFLVYDPARKRYYASVTSTETQGNRIATIDATTGTVSYSALIGSSPKTMALTADGSALYVGLDGSGEVVRLQMPAMTESARVRLPMDPFFGQLFAEEIAASPLSPDVIAVSTYRKGISPRHGGVVLVRSNVVQALKTQDHTGSNSIGFDPSGSWLYGYNNETTEFGLRRIEVVADGLIERNVVNADVGFSARLRIADGLIVVGSRAFRTEPALGLVGTVADAQDCVKLPSVAKIACHHFDFSSSNALAIVDSVAFARVGTPTYSAGGPSVYDRRWRLVPATSGSLAVDEETRVVLYSDELLR